MTSLVPGSRMGNYQVLGLLGAGGMGEVYRARDTRLARDVALKVLPPAVATDPERLARFEREAHLLASLNHPHIAAIYGVEETGGAPALVLELVEGPTLGDRIARGALAAEEVAPIALQIAQALEYAHERGIVHRDLKPANVKLDAEGNVKVLDFGLAKAMAGDPGAGMSLDPSLSPTVTSLGSVVGVILGTAAYMSPEQARGSTVDRRTDIWSFGAVLWEMLTGKRTFEGETVSDTLASVLRAPIEWETLPSSVPPAIVKLLRRCLERDPKKRLRDIGEARILLETPAEALAPAAPARAAATELAAPPRTPWKTALPWALFALASVVAAVALRPRPVVDPEPLRFEVGVPKSLLRVSWPRLSPDGRTLAFLGRDDAGKQSIWVRPLHSFEAHPLAGTEGAARPFWSPDSRELAFFFDRRQLLKISVTGGPTQLICEASGGSDGTWSSSGVILFDGNASDPIRKCPATGGEASVQIENDSSKDHVYSWPFFLPDGRHFLCTAYPRTGPTEQKIYVGSLDDPAMKPLVVTDTRAEYASGHLVYIVRNTLVAQAFDTSKLAVSGDVVPIAAGVSAAIPADFSVSPNGALAYVASPASGNDQLVWVDRKGVELGKEGTPGTYREVALSPDGSRLAYDGSDGTQYDIWVRDLRRGVAMRLTSDTGNDRWPAWSPDGSRIAFSSDRAGPFKMLQKSSLGTGAEESLLADSSANLGVMEWSPDGRYLLYGSFSTTGGADVKLLAMQGERRSLDYLTEKAQETTPSFSPDGRFIAYRSDESGQNEIYVQPFPATGAKWTISSQGGSGPQWRRDGKELFFKSADDTIYAVPITLSPVFDAGIPVALFKRRLEPGGILRNRWVVSADGQKFLLNALVTDRSEVPFSVVLNWTQALDKR